MDVSMRDLIRGFWRKGPAGVVMPGCESLWESEWCPGFERAMRCRLVMGAFRYGRLGASGKPQWDRLERIERCVRLYRKTGNQEHLVDGANMFLLEFVEGNHPRKHFDSADDANHTKLR